LKRLSGLGLVFNHVVEFNPPVGGREGMIKFPAASANAEAAQRRRCCGNMSPELPRALKLLSGGAALGFNTLNPGK